jgi:proteasome accessory factor C
MAGRVSAEERLGRVLAMVPWVVERGGATIDEIAAAFGVPPPQVLADLSLVQCCEVPPYGPDHTLGITVVDDEVLVDPGAMLGRPLRLGPREGFGLLAAGRTALAALGDDGSAGPLVSALAKLERALGARTPLDVDLDRPEWLPTLRDALAGRHRLDIDYLVGWRDEMTTREVDPVAIVNHEGRWYVQAWCHRAGGFRTFRVDRIDAIRPTAARFDPPDPATVPEPRFAPGEEGVEVVLHLPADARWVVETYPTRQVEERADGDLVVTLVVAGTVFLERLLLRVGSRAQVRSPAELVDLGARAAREVLERYEPTAVAGHDG